MSRLFVFGCSFTRFLWHSYADLFAQNYNLAMNREFNILTPHAYDYYQNWAYPGLGNRAIAERLVECHIKNNINSDDLVIVQWSGHLRNDYASFRKMPMSNRIIWKTEGSIFGEDNIALYGEEYIKKFVDEKAYFLSTLHYICMIQNLLENIGCKWLMLSSHNLETVELGHDILNRDNRKSIFDVDKDFMPYKKVFDHYIDNWLPNLMDFKNSVHDLDWYWKADSNKSSLFEIFKGKKVPVNVVKNGFRQEGHLSPEQNMLYVENIKNKLDLPLDIPIDQTDLMWAYDQFKYNVGHDIRAFGDIVHNVYDYSPMYGFTS